MSPTSVSLSSCRGWLRRSADLTESLRFCGLGTTGDIPGKTVETCHRESPWVTQNRPPLLASSLPPGGLAELIGSNAMFVLWLDFTHCFIYSSVLPVSTLVAEMESCGLGDKVIRPPRTQLCPESVVHLKDHQCEGDQLQMLSPFGAFLTQHFSRGQRASGDDMPGKPAGVTAERAISDVLSPNQK